MSAPEVSWSVREVNRAAAALEQELGRRLDLRPLDHAALNHVMTAAAPMGPSELSARIGISTGSTTELVDRLERSGHLERRRAGGDRRRVSLHVTEQGVGRVLAHLAPVFAAVDEVAEQFTPAEQETISRYLRAVARRMDEWTQSDR